MSDIASDLMTSIFTVRCNSCKCCFTAIMEESQRVVPCPKCGKTLHSFIETIKKEGQLRGRLAATRSK